MRRPSQMTSERCPSEPPSHPLTHGAVFGLVGRQSVAETHRSGEGAEGCFIDSSKFVED